MKVERTTTGVVIRDATDDVKRLCLQYFSLPNPLREFFIYSRNDADSKHRFGDHDVIYVTSGILSIPNNHVVENLKSLVKVIEPPKCAMVSVTSTREPRSDLQLDCIAKLTDPNCAPKVTVEAKPGTGKEEPYSRKIPTPTEHGYTLMGDLHVGEFVFDRNGRLTRILEIFEQGVKDVYKLTFEDGRKAYCGECHLWNVQRDGSDVWETKMLKELLKDNDYTSYSIPRCLPVDYPKQEVPIHPWMLGCYIGCGITDALYLTLKSDDEALIDKFAFIGKYNYASDDGRYTFYQDGNPVMTSTFLKDIHESIQDNIPEIYRINTPIYRLNLLQGLMDANGVITESGISFPTKSETMKHQILWLLQSLGHSGRIDDSGLTFILPKKHMWPYFTIHSKCGYPKDHKEQQEPFNQNLRITNIEFSHREKCRCIMVDNPEHLYLTEDFIVTHNTFMALYAISQLGKKPLIVAPTTLLKNQWIDSLVELGISKTDIATDIRDGCSRTFCVVTISALENCMREDWHGLMNSLEKSRFGIKIIDEAHLHLKGVLKFDAICNIEHNWYMSATLGRSDASEDRILNRALKDADRFIGNGIYDEYKKQYVNVLLQDIWYYPSASFCQKYFRYGSKGLVRATYYNMLLAYNGGKSFIRNIINVIKRTKNLIKSDKRILVLVPLREAIELVKNAIYNDAYFQNMKIGTVDGTMSLSERKFEMQSDIIISTSMSMGTGIDLQDLIAVINFDQYASPIITEQICGRLRDRGYECYYVDICDHVRYAKVIESWGMKRRIVLPYFPGVKQDIKRLPNIRF